MRNPAVEIEPPTGRVRWQPPAIATKAAQALSMKYAVAFDKDGAAMSAYGAKSLPTLFIIDKKGVIREIVNGYDPSKHAEVEKLLKTLLAEPAPAVTATAAPAATATAAPAVTAAAAPAAAPAAPAK